MQKLDSFEFKTTGPVARYDWDTLLSGDILKLSAGEDFNCTPHTFGMMARNQGKKRGLQVRTSMQDEGQSIIIQAVALPEGTTVEDLVEEAPVEETPKGKGGKRRKTEEAVA